MNFKLVYRGLVATGLALLLSAPLAALADETEPRATTHEDIWLVKRISAPVISPDGHHAVVSVTEPAYDKDDQTSDLWLIALDGSQSPRQLTSTPGGESGVDWSPEDRKSTRLNSSHVAISYAVFCLKKKKQHDRIGCPV